MLRKYSIMPHAIILYLFGLTLMTVSPVFAQENTVKLKTSDAPSRAELPLGLEDVGAFESKENQGGSPITLEGQEPVELEAGFDYVETETHTGREMEPEPHLNKRILQLQKKSLATPTEDEGS